jgi:Lhr-like helicase
MDPLSIFHPIIREWFERHFSAPTEAQALGWPAIAQGCHTLISAPTGSGKDAGRISFVHRSVAARRRQQ